MPQISCDHLLKRFDENDQDVCLSNLRSILIQKLIDEYDSNDGFLIYEQGEVRTRLHSGQITLRDIFDEMAETFFNFCPCCGKKLKLDIEQIWKEISDEYDK